MSSTSPPISSPKKSKSKPKTRRNATKQPAPPIINLHQRSKSPNQPPIHKTFTRRFIDNVVESVMKRLTRRGDYKEGKTYASEKKKEKKDKTFKRLRSTIKSFINKNLKQRQEETERKCYRYFINWVTIENLIFYQEGQTFIMDVPIDAPEDPCSNYLNTNCPDKIGKVKCIKPPNNGAYCIDEQRKAVLKEGHVIKDRYLNKPYKIERIDSDTMYQFIYRNNTLYVVIKSGSIIKNLYEDDTTMMIIEDIVKAVNTYLAKDRKKMFGLVSNPKIKKIVFGGHSYGCVCSLLILRNHLIALRNGTKENRINMDLSKIFVVGSAPFPWLKPEEVDLFTDDVQTRIMVYGIIQNYGRYLPDFNGVDRFIYGITGFHDYKKYEMIRDEDDDDDSPDKSLSHTSPEDKVVKLIHLPMRFLYYTASKMDIVKALDDIYKRKNNVKNEFKYTNYTELPHNRSISLNSLNTQHPVLEYKDIDFIEPEFLKEHTIVSLDKSMRVNQFVTEYTHSWACYRHIFNQFVKANTAIKPQSTPA